MIQWLWDLLENGLDSEDDAASLLCRIAAVQEAPCQDMGRFLMFATSCSRPPLLGTCARIRFGARRTQVQARRS